MLDGKLPSAHQYRIFSFRGAGRSALHDHCVSAFPQRCWISAAVFVFGAFDYLWWRVRCGMQSCLLVAVPLDSLLRVALYLSVIFLQLVEARVRVEPAHSALADCGLPTWLPRPPLGDERDSTM